MPAKTVDRSEMTDSAPVLDRTRGLPDDARFLWFSGTLGGDAPGPSTYWLDAMVTMTEHQAQKLREVCPPDGVSVGSASAPDVLDALETQIPVDDLMECPELATQIEVDGWQTRAWMSPTEPVLVLSLLGQG